MRRYALSVSLFTAISLLAAGCSKDKESKPQPEPAKPVAPVPPPELPPSPLPPATTTAPGTGPSAQAPATQPGDMLVSIESLSVSLQPASGRALAVLFWNTRDAAMDVQSKAAAVLYQRFHAKGLDMVSICNDASEDRVIDFAERWQFVWPQVMNSAAADPKPFERFKIEKTPACLLLKSGEKPAALKLDATDETHAAVAKALEVKLADLPMPDPPSRYSAERSARRVDPIVQLKQQLHDGAPADEITEQIVATFEDDDSRAKVDEVVDALCESKPKGFASMVEKAMSRISPEAQIRMVRAIMVKAPDQIECVFPAVKKMKADDKTLENVTRWDRSQLGRAMVLAGEFEQGAKVLRKVAEETENEGAWWYMVGWAELCGGRPEPAKEAFKKSYRSDGEYSGVAAKVAGSMAGYFLGKLDEKALKEAQESKSAQFFIAERYMLAGDEVKAIEAYNACIKAGKKSSDPWPCNWAQVRLQQIEKQVDGLPKTLPPGSRLWEQSTANKPASSPST